MWNGPVHISCMFQDVVFGIFLSGLDFRKSLIFLWQGLSLLHSQSDNETSHCSRFSKAITSLLITQLWRPVCYSGSDLMIRHGKHTPIHYFHWRIAVSLDYETQSVRGEIKWHQVTHSISPHYVTTENAPLSLHTRAHIPSRQQANWQRAHQFTTRNTQDQTAPAANRNWDLERVAESPNNESRQSHFPFLPFLSHFRVLNSYE